MSRFYSQLRACAALALLGALPAQAATIVVTSGADGAPGTACTLRSAVQAANTNTAVGGCTAGDADGDVITFAAGVSTITLAGSEILITDDVTINGAVGTDRVIVDAAGNSRIFDVQAPAGTGTARRVQFANLELRNGNSSNGSSSAPDAGGAVDLKPGSQATFTNTDVLNSVCGINGGGIHGAGNTDIVITTTGNAGSVIQNNDARGPESNRGGGGVWGAGTVTITGNVLIRDNRASGAAGSGGGVFNLGGALTIGEGVVIQNNTANRAGGGVESAGGTVMMRGVTVSGNNAGTNPGNGGGVHGGGDAMIRIAGGTYTGNRAVEGGGLWISEGGTLLVAGATVSGNLAVGNASDQGGGGLYSDGGTISLIDVLVEGNTAAGSSGSGGGILTKGTLVLSVTRVQGNASIRAGGGIEVVGAQNVRVEGSLIQSNNAGFAPGFGGGLHITGAGGVTVTGTTVQGNVAVEGGGLWKAAPGTLTVSNSNILSNTATGDASDQGGGGVYSDGGGGLTIDASTINGNIATGAAGSGGGVFNNGGTIAITNTRISNNLANRAGGGIEDNSGDGLTLTNVTLAANNAGTAPGNGGGLHISGDGVVTMAGGFVLSNTAVEGGGLWKSGAGTLTVSGTRIEGNVATGASADQGGGGVYNDGAGGTLTLSGVALVSNAASGASGSGGGLLNNTGGTAVVTGSTFLANTSNRAGGGIEDNAGGGLTVRQTLFQGNRTGSAPGNGGALHITGASTVSVDSSRVLSNVAVNEGGGFWNSGAGSLTVSYSTFTDNRSGSGGGLYQTAGSGTTVLRTSLVNGNRASGAGGGITADGGTITVQNTSVTDNIAASGAGIIANGGQVAVQSATIVFNNATTVGGGLRNAGTDANALSVRNSIVSGNSAPTGANLSGAITSNGFNLFRTTAGATVTSAPGAGADLTGVDPQLLPLADNGGPTLTYAVAGTSPAVGAGNTLFVIDQRGFTRPTSGGATIGAFEFNGTAPPTALVAETEDTLSKGGADLAPVEFGLSAATPNPFRGQTTMRVSSPDEQAVEVVLYDALGRRVQTVYAGTPSGSVDVTVNAGSLAPGVYVVRMTGATQAATQRVTIAR